MVMVKRGTLITDTTAEGGPKEEIVMANCTVCGSACQAHQLTDGLCRTCLDKKEKNEDKE